MNYTFTFSSGIIKDDTPKSTNKPTHRVNLFRTRYTLFEGTLEECKNFLRTKANKGDYIVKI